LLFRAVACDTFTDRVLVKVSGRMRLLNSADGLEDFPEPDEFFTVTSGGHGRDPQRFSKGLVGSGSLPLNNVENKPCSVS
jgi:hypothetical protein